MISDSLESSSRPADLPAPAAAIGDGSRADTTLSDTFLVIRKRKWMILFAALLGFAYGYYKASSQPRLYIAYGDIEIRSGVQSEYRVNSAPLAEDTYDIPTQTAILKSDNLLLTVARDLDLPNNPQFIGAKGPIPHRSIDDANVREEMLGALPAAPAEFVPPGACDALEPDEEHFSEATGNGGASYERTYRRAALVLWDRNNLFAVLGQGGVSAMLAHLEGLVNRMAEAGRDQRAPIRADAQTLVRHMLEHWPVTRYPQAEPSEAARLLTALVRLDDGAAIEMFVTDIIATGTYRASDNAALIDTLERVPPDRRIQLIERVIGGTATALFGACADLLARSVLAWPSLPAARQAPAATALLEHLPNDARPAVPPVLEYRRQKVDAACVVDLLTALCAIDSALGFRAVVHILTFETAFDMDTMLVPAARALLDRYKTDRPEAVEQLRLACLEHLRARIAEPLEPPSDWRRPHDVPCQCGHCTELSRFLADPQRPAWTFKANAMDRSHVEETIQKAQCDVDTETEQRGRPYSLICTKNEASFHRRTQQRTEDLKNVAVLEA